MSVDCKEKEFFECVYDVLKKLRRKNCLDEENARIALEIMKKFRPALKKLFEDNYGKDILKLKIEDVIEEPCQHDLRCEMDNNLINEIAQKGYNYCAEESTYEELIFLKNKH